MIKVGDKITLGPDRWGIWDGFGPVFLVDDINDYEWLIIYCENNPTILFEYPRKNAILYSSNEDLLATLPDVTFNCHYNIVALMQSGCKCGGK